MTEKLKSLELWAQHRIVVDNPKTGESSIYFNGQKVGTCVQKWF